MTSKRYHSGVFITKSEQTNAAWVPSYNLVDIYLLWLYICMGKKNTSESKINKVLNTSADW